MDDDDLRTLPSRCPGAWGRVHEHHAEIGSTNERALAWLREGAPHGAVVTADAQTAGRGRRGRTWRSPAGEGLWVSVVLRPPPSPDPGRLGALGLAVGVGLREGLMAAMPELDPPVMLKWPNDLRIAGRKLGGILCEARWMGGPAQADTQVVVGFGINVHTRTFPAPLDAIATSLAQHGGGTAPGRAALLATVLASLEPTVEAFLRDGFAAVRARYLAWSEVLGRAVEVGDAQDPAAARRGVAERIDEAGALWVRPAEGGAAFRVQSADVWLQPPSP